MLYLCHIPSTCTLLNSGSFILIALQICLSLIFQAIQRQICTLCFFLTSKSEIGPSMSLVWQRPSGWNSMPSGEAPRGGNSPFLKHHDFGRLASLTLKRPASKSLLFGRACIKPYKVAASCADPQLILTLWAPANEYESRVNMEKASYCYFAFHISMPILVSCCPPRVAGGKSDNRVFGIPASPDWGGQRTEQGFEKHLWMQRTWIACA